MKTLLPILLLAPLLPLAARAQVGIGTPTPDPKAALEIRATDKGLLIPRLTAAQRTALTGVPQGLLVYQTDGTASGGSQTGFWYYGGSGGWVFLDASAGSSLTLPFSGSYGGSAATPAFDVSHTNGGFAIRGSAPNTGVGVYGVGSTGSGVYGTASGSGGYGVRGATTANNTAGVYGTATGGTNTYGVIGDAQIGVQGQGGGGAGLSGTSTSGPALLAAKAGGQTGRAAELTLIGTGNDSTAVYVSSAAPRPAVRAVNTNASAQAALRGVKTAGTDGVGVEGVITSGGGNAAGVLGNDLSNTGLGSGVIGRTKVGFGVQGIAMASNGWGVYGQATNSYGVIGSSTSGVGVSGSSSSNYGVQGVSTSGVGVQGTASNSSLTSGAVVGNNSNTGTAATGVLGLTKSGYGVRGVASATGGYGVAGVATDSYGVWGQSTDGAGVYGSTSNSGSSVAGVVGVNSATAGYGVLGSAPIAVRGASDGPNGIGVYGTASGSFGQAVFGQGSSGAVGIEGNSSGSGPAGIFSKTGTSSGAVVRISQAGSTTDPALDVTGGAIRTPEVNSAGTGTANLLPVAYGRVSRTGTVLGGTGNFTAVQSLPSYGVYVLTISNLSSSDLTNAVCQVTCRYGVPGQPNAQFTATANGQPNGKVEVHVSNLATPTDLAEADFTFVVYQP